MIRTLKKLVGETNPIRLFYHRVRSWLSAFSNGFPARNMFVIGVTGTDGKTTTVAMISHILRSSGIRTAAVSTAFFETDEVREANPTQKTSVDPGVLQSFLKRVKQKGINHVVIEASSHGLLQGRLSGIKLDLALITNTSPEHLDYHGTMEKYIRAKGILFKSLKKTGVKVLNRDDGSFETLSRIPSHSTFSYSPNKQIKDIQADAYSSRGVFSLEGRNTEVRLNIPGSFNLKNALAAIISASALGIRPGDAARALENFRGAGGRMEKIDGGQGFEVYVDFTVTPASYEQTLIAARKIAKNNRILVLTGSCGDRMPEKRPLVGEICFKHADIIVVTNEDPYTEDPEIIIDEVYGGVPNTFPKFIDESAFTGEIPQRFCIRISDRLNAIRFLFRQARPGDVVLLCGKGADVTMMTKTGQIPWNEREIALKELKELSRSSFLS